VLALQKRVRELERVLDEKILEKRDPARGSDEAFVKTFKRSYVYVHECPDAQTALSQLSAWFEDYNENHAHKASQTKSPREFIRSYQQPAACPVG
jgi:putative transposase